MATTMLPALRAKQRRETRKGDGIEIDATTHLANIDRRKGLPVPFRTDDRLFG
jgi:hypothetical protein